MKCPAPIFLLLLLALGACSSGPEPEAPLRLALEAWIDQDGYPVAILSRAITPSDQAVDAADVVVRWGRVRLTDGRDTVTLTGGADPSVFPPYSYRGYDLRGRVGGSYTLLADYHGVELRATARILPPPVIDAVEFDAVTDSLCSAVLSFTAPADADTCRYVVFTRVLSRESRHYPAYLGAVSSYAPGQRCRVPLCRGIHAANRDPFQPHFVVGDTIDVVLARVEPRVYDYWRGYQDAVYFGHAVFISTAASPVGNVEGGLGVFSARGIARLRIAVPSAEPMVVDRIPPIGG